MVWEQLRETYQDLLPINLLSVARVRIGQLSLLPGYECGVSATGLGLTRAAGVVYRDSGGYCTFRDIIVDPVIAALVAVTTTV